MKPLTHIIQILTFAAVLQSVVLLIHLSSKKSGSKYERRILIVLFISFMIFLSGNALLLLYGGNHFWKTYHSLNLIIFFSSPLLYLYFLGKLNAKSSFTIADGLHFIIVLPILAIAITKVMLSTHKSLPFNNYGPIITAGLFLQNLIYLFLVLAQIRKKRKSINTNKLKLYNKQATLNSINFELTGLHKLFLAFFGIMLLKTGVFLSCRIFSLFTFCVLFTGVFFILAFILINCIVLFGLSRSTLFEEKERYASRTIDDSLKENYLQKLEIALLKERVYRDSLITLDKLSKLLKIPRNDLSRIINENYALNFNEMINQLRIDEAKQLISENNGEIPIIEIAYKVGYNSKSTFNTAFKRYTGKTPSSFSLN